MVNRQTNFGSTFNVLESLGPRRSYKSKTVTVGIAFARCIEPAIGIERLY